MTRPIAGTITIIATTALVATVSIWSASARGGSTPSNAAAATYQAHCTTVSSGGALGADSGSGTTIRSTVGQSIIGATSDGKVFVRTGVHACLSPRLVAPLFADFDQNRSVDLDDLYDMVDCIGGPGKIVEASCEIGIADDDGDIDMRDLAEFQRVFAAIQ